MKIPFLDLTRHCGALNNEINEAFARVIRRGNFILGKEVEAFESEWADFCETKGAVSVANGTDAITLAIKAAGAIETNNEIITTPLSAAYTALAIVNSSAKPIFVDVDEKTFTLNPEQLEKAITPQTRGIIPVHLYGQIADMKAINEIAERHKLFVIEDAAQSHGARFDGKPCGSKSLAATYSFYPTKNLGAFGDGGAIISNNKDFLMRLRKLRQGGHFETLQANLTGLNSRLDEMQAAFLRVKLKKLNEWTIRRRELAQIYFEGLKDLPNLQLPFIKAGNEHVFHLFVIRHKERDRLKKFLFERGIETIIHYPYLLNQQNIFRQANQNSLPIAEKIVDEILSLPLYPQMKNSEVEEICETIADFY
jgi:dTDP-4-amino-4,6-dideoxygalactose transaminase